MPQLSKFTYFTPCLGTVLSYSLPMPGKLQCYPMPVKVLSTPCLGEVLRYPMPAKLTLPHAWKATFVPYA